jgi:hypothetical protein
LNLSDGSRVPMRAAGIAIDVHIAHHWGFIWDWRC